MLAKDHSFTSFPFLFKLHAILTFNQVSGKKIFLLEIYGYISKTYGRGDTILDQILTKNEDICGYVTAILITFLKLTTAYFMTCSPLNVNLTYIRCSFDVSV